MKTLDALLIVAAFVVASIATSPVVGQGPVLHPANADGGTAEDDFKYRTAADCLRCHQQPTAQDSERGVTDRVLLTEGATWFQHDKHAQAFAALTNARSRRIAQLLGQDVLAKETGCVACHTTNIHDTAWLEQQPTAIEQGHAEGVACEACHGASSEWYEQHTRASWRKLSPAEKARHGFTPLKDPVVRAETCLSCHLGDARQGRVITHEMYAAGHPPLSGFEPESAADRMPRHWRYDDEKPGLAEAADPFQRTRYALTASIVGLRMAVELAVDNGAGEGADTQWPELARLDCYGCHHELQADSWRQRRAAGGPAGRTELAVGCLSLLEAAAIAADEVDGPANLDGAINHLREPFQQQVFGDIGQLQAAAPDVVAWSRGVEEELRTADLGGDRSWLIADGLFGRSRNRLLDYDAARQLGGAATLYFDEHRQATQQAEGPAAAAALEELAAVLDLHADGRPSIEEELPLRLKQRALHRPELFRELLDALAPPVVADPPVAAP